MAIANSTDSNIRAAYKQVCILEKELQQYVQGDVSAASLALGNTGRFPAATIDATITALKTAVDAINSAS